MLTTTKISARHQKESVYLVLDAYGREVGLLTKFRDTRSTRNPWKAYLGVGAASRFLGAFYPEDGGKDAALAAIDAAWLEEAVADCLPDRFKN